MVRTTEPLVSVPVAVLTRFGLVRVTVPVGTGSPLGPLIVTVVEMGKFAVPAGGTTLMVGVIDPAEFTVIGKFAFT